MGFRFTSFIVVYKAKKVKSASTGISIKDVPENKNNFFLQKLKKMYKKKKKKIPFTSNGPCIRLLTQIRMGWNQTCPINLLQLLRQKLVPLWCPRSPRVKLTPTTSYSRAEKRHNMRLRLLYDSILKTNNSISWPLWLLTFQVHASKLSKIIILWWYILFQVRMYIWSDSWDIEIRSKQDVRTDGQTDRQPENMIHFWWWWLRHKNLTFLHLDDFEPAHMHFQHLKNHQHTGWPSQGRRGSGGGLSWSHACCPTAIATLPAEHGMCKGGAPNLGKQHSKLSFLPDNRQWWRLMALSLLFLQRHLQAKEFAAVGMLFPGSLLFHFVWWQHPRVGPQKSCESGIRIPCFHADRDFLQ